MKCLLPETLAGVPRWKCPECGESDVAGKRHCSLAIFYKDFGYASGLVLMGKIEMGI